MMGKQLLHCNSIKTRSSGPREKKAL